MIVQDEILEIINNVANKQFIGICMDEYVTLVIKKQLESSVAHICEINAIISISGESILFDMGEITDERWIYLQ